MITQFIESNFEKVLKIQSGFSHDAEMVSSIKSEALTEKMVKDWMRVYGLYQGLNNEVRNNVAKAFIEFAYENNNGNGLNVEIKFQELHSKLKDVAQRNWISATSKLLWCIDPYNVVIYDSFVERAIGVLQCLDVSLAKFPRLNSVPNAKNDPQSEKITKFYMNYQNMVKNVKDSNDVVIQKLKKKYKSEYKYDIRMIDKLLWLMGSSSSTFNYNEIECKPSE